MGRCLRFAALVLAACLLASCAETPLSARRVNPLKQPAAHGGSAWQPGDLSAATTALIEKPGILLTLASAAEEARRLEPLAGANAARRALVELCLWAGEREQASFGRRTDIAAGFYLCAAEWSEGDAAFYRAASRYATARLFDLLGEDLCGGRLEFVLPGPTRTYHFAAHESRAGDGTLPPQRFHFLHPTDRYRVLGASRMVETAGLGAPLVAEVRGPRDAVARKTFQPPDGQLWPMTAVLHFGPRSAGARDVSVSLHDPRVRETAIIGGRAQPLAADFTTPLGVTTKLRGGSFLNAGVLGFLRSNLFIEKSGLFPAEQVQPGKIPVIFVHGLVSEPHDWRFIQNDVMSDPVLRARYQLWVFHYPTSVPVVYSSMLLRQGLHTARGVLDPAGRNPSMRHLTLIGHSMGGLLSRMQIVDGGEAYYRTYFKRPLNQLRLTRDERELVQNAIFFKANPDIGCVTFVCTPHQGSGLAGGIVGKIARLLAGLPTRLIGATMHIITLNRDALVDDAARPGSSIDSLTPGSRLFTALSQMPPQPRTHLHSIIGDRGKGGDVWHSSDGVVPYWSSHIEPVDSEVVLPASHSALADTRVSEEIRRILRDQLKGRR